MSSIAKFICLLGFSLTVNTYGISQKIKAYPQWAGIIKAKNSTSFVNFVGADIDFKLKHLNLLTQFSDTILIYDSIILPLTESGKACNSILLTSWDDLGNLIFQRILTQSSSIYNLKIQSNTIDSGFWISGIYQNAFYWENQWMDSSTIQNTNRLMLASYDPKGKLKFIKSYQTYSPNSSYDFTLFPRGNTWYLLDANFNGLSPLHLAPLERFNFPNPWRSALFVIKPDGSIDSGMAIPKAQFIEYTTDSGYWIGANINDNSFQTYFTSIDSGFSFGADTLKEDNSFYFTYTKDFKQFDSIYYFTKFNAGYSTPFRSISNNLLMGQVLNSSLVLRDSLLDDFTKGNGSKIAFSQFSRNGLKHYLSNTYQNNSGTYCSLNNLQGYGNEIWSDIRISAGCTLDGVAFKYNEAGLMNFSSDIHVNRWLSYYFNDADNPWSFWLEQNKFFHIGQMNNHIIGLNGTINEANPGSLCILFMDTSYVNMSLGYNPISELECIIYPNPTNGEFFIQTSLTFEFTPKIDIRNIQGQSIFGYPKTISSKDNLIKFSIQGQPAGIYFIGLETSKGISWQKLLLL